MALRHWWPLDNIRRDQGTDAFAFLSRHENITWTAGKMTNCAVFSGNSYLQWEMQNSFKPQIFSITAWAKVSSLPQNESEIICCFESGGAGLYFARQHICFSVYINGDGYKDVEAETTANEWHHYVATWDGQTERLYIDGELKATLEIGTSEIFYNRAPWTIGANPDNNGYISGDYLTGQVSDVRIYDNVLLENEIKDLAKGLALHYNFEVCPIKNLLIDQFNVYSDGSGNLSYTPYVYNGMSGYRIQQSVNQGWGSYLRWRIDPEVLNKNQKYSFSIWAVSLNNTNASISNHIDNAYSNNAFINAHTKTITNELQLLKWEGEIPNNTYNPNGELWNYGWHWDVNSDHADIFIANPKFEASEECTFFSSYMDPNDQSVHGVINITNNTGYSSYNGVVKGSLYISDDTACGTKSLQFSSNSYIDIPDTPAYSEATFCFWVKIPTNEDTYRFIFGGKGNPEYYGTLWISVNTEGSGLWTYNKIGGDDRKKYCQGGDMLEANKWYFCVYTFKNGTGQCYINGEPVGEPTTYDNNYLRAGDNTIGDSYTGDSWYGTVFDGQIADFKIYATCLSDQEIKNLYKRSYTLYNSDKFYCMNLVEKGTGIKIKKEKILQVSEINENITNKLSFIHIQDNINTELYEQLEYIETTGAEYVDIEDFPYGGHMILNIKCCLLENTGTDQDIIADRKNDGVDLVLANFRVNGKSLQARYVGWLEPLNFNALNIGNFYNIKCDFKEGSQKMSFNDSNILWRTTEGTGGVATGLTSGTTTMRIFNDRENRYPFIGRLCYLKYSKDNELLYNFIPVRRKNDSHIGLLNIVSNTFYENIGSGAFIAGPKYNGKNVLTISQLIEQ